MEYDCGERLGMLLLRLGELTPEELERALNAQLETGAPLGEILLENGAVCRPVLDRALAEQRGVDLHFERGFGSGLREEIERRHRLRRRVGRLSTALPIL